MIVELLNVNAMDITESTNTQKPILTVGMALDVAWHAFTNVTYRYLFAYLTFSAGKLRVAAAAERSHFAPITMHGRYFRHSIDLIPELFAFESNTVRLNKMRN